MADKAKENPSKVEARGDDAPLKVTERDFEPTQPLATPQDPTSPTLISPGLLEEDGSRLAQVHAENPPEDWKPALDPTPLKDAPTVIYAGSNLKPSERPSTAHVVDGVAPQT